MNDGSAPPAATLVPFAGPLLGLAAAVAAISVGAALARPDAPPHVEAPFPTIDQAAGLIAQRLVATPEDVRGWRLLAELRQQQGDAPAAAAAWRRVTVLAPQDPAGWSGLAAALTAVDRGRVGPEARAALARAPADPQARYLAGVARLQDGDRAGAIAAWRTLLAAAPPDAPWRGGVAAAIREAGER